MHPYEISVLDDRFLFFSLPSERDFSGEAAAVRRCVILLPSLDADFRVIGYEKGGKPLYDYYSAALCAAAHLTSKQGLPLSEIVFEIPTGFLKIACTGGGLFSVDVNKCKLMLPKNVEICGCEADVCDVLAQGLFRVMTVCDAARFDKKVLSRLSSAVLPLPSAVVLSSLENERLSVRTYTDYNPTPPSSLLAYAAAAYRAWEEKRLSFSCAMLPFENSSFCRVRYSTVEMTVKPTFII